MKCDCRSYNGGFGTTPEMVLELPDFLKVETGRESVCVDSCIADVILNLWEMGISTFACCCGHNGLTPRSIVVGTVEEERQARRIAGDSFAYWSLERPETFDEAYRRGEFQPREEGGE